MPAARGRARGVLRRRCARSRASNEALFATVEESSLAWERGTERPFPIFDLEVASRRFVGDLLAQRNGFVGSNQQALLGALAAERMAGPIVSPQVF